MKASDFDLLRRILFEQAKILQDGHHATVNEWSDIASELDRALDLAMAEVERLIRLEGSVSVLVRVSDGWFVAMPGSTASYTPYLQQARTFGTTEQAKLERCIGNETIVAVTTILQRNRIP